jgi:uncharacterized membrane protein (UPF0127 family)
MRGAPVLLVLVTLLGGLALAGVIHVLAGRAEGRSTAPAATTPETTASGATTSGATTSGATTSGTTTTSSSAEPNTVTIDASGGEKVKVKVEIADTLTEQQRGLMERTKLAEDAGMLFVFGREQQLSFFMKDTLIPLSVAYINENGRIVDIQDMEPLDETPHPSAEPARYALEVNQGFFRDHGVKVGDTAELPRVTASTKSPSSTEVVQAFKDAGLEVGNSYPVEQEPDWNEKPLPRTYKEATRFEIPSLGEETGGRVFVFQSEEDLIAVRDYYDSLDISIRPYIYTEGKVLLQMSNRTPQAEAERYQAVLKQVA